MEIQLYSNEIKPLALIFGMEYPWDTEFQVWWNPLDPK